MQVQLRRMAYSGVGWIYRQRIDGVPIESTAFGRDSHREEGDDGVRQVLGVDSLGASMSGTFG